MLLTYLGDALWIAALTIMFAASRQAAGKLGERVRLLGAEVPRGLALWALPAAAFLVSLGLAFQARTQDGGADAVLIMFGARAVLASLAALSHLRLLADALKP
jgi:hypothetical protein